MSDYDTADVYTSPEDYGAYETCHRAHAGELDPLLLADPAWAAEALDRLEHCACDVTQTLTSSLVGSCVCSTCSPTWSVDPETAAAMARGTATGMFTALKPHYRTTHDGPHGFRRVVWKRSLELSRLLAHPPLRLSPGESKRDLDFVRSQVAELLEHLRFTDQEEADRAALRAAIERGTA
ncbi:hypothetical protein [Amycolatopsis sp. NBC_00438]|uniref:hypothetical protein n=1 Tax=Amycolatopsis sp. NBC_00438 TaxID=2903558 RepID=UPI002E1AF2B1